MTSPARHHAAVKRHRQEADLQDRPRRRERRDLPLGGNLVGLDVQKALCLDVVAKLTAADIADIHIPAKLEGLAFGQDVMVDGAAKHTLYIANDNDFEATAVDKHVAIVDNPDQLFAFAFDDDDLPGFVPQKFAGGSLIVR
jgi:hypothetical protein